jgi:hypothetical protein
MPSLKIELIVDDKGNVTISKAEKGLEALNAEATKLGSSFAGALGKMQTTLEGMNTSLKKTEAHTKQASQSMAALSRSILRLYAQYYILSSAIQAVGSAILKSIDIIDQYNNAITTMAALITSRLKFNHGETLAEGYKRARTYAEGLMGTLVDIDKHVTMNLQELIEMSQEMIRQGVILDTNNQEAVKGFTNVANALSTMIGNVPDRMRQINQEIRALLTGQTRESDKLAKSVASMTPEFAKQIEIHRKAGDLWQWLGGLLRGFSAAQSDIDRSWQTMKSTLQTIGMQIARLGLDSMFREVVAWAGKLSQWADAHKEQIADGLAVAWRTVKAGMEETWAILKQFAPALRLMVVYLEMMLQLRDKMGAARGVIMEALFGATPVGALLNVLERVDRILNKVSGQGNQAGQRIPVGVPVGTPVPELKDTVDKKAADEAKRLFDQYTRSKNTVADSVAQLRAEISQRYSLGVQLEKNRIAYSAYVRDIDEKLSPAQRKNLSELARQEFALKNINAMLEDGAKRAKNLADKEADEWKQKDEAAKLTEQQKEAFDALYLSLDPVIGASRRYSRALEDIKNAQALLNTGQGGTITQEQINRATALLEAQKNVYNTGYVADYYSQISSLEDEALQKRLAAIEEERKMNALLFDERTAQILANQQMAEAYVEAIVKKNKPIMDMFGGMAELLEGIGSLYEKGSSQAKTFADAANALTIAQKALAVVNAVAAVAASASAPWPVQWANMAAMLAAMGSLLGSIGTSINGGGGHGESAESYKPTTVLGGASGEASKSIQNALELLNDVNGESYVELVGIHRNMRELNNNITGLVRSILQGDKGYTALTNSIDMSSKSGWELLGGFGSFMQFVFDDILGGVADLIGKIPLIGGLAGGIVGGVVNIVDWIVSGVLSGFGSVKKKVTQQGIQMVGTTVSDILEGIIVEGLYYTTVQTKKKSWGHVSRSNKTYYQAMDAETERLFNLVYQGIAGTLVAVGSGLGLGTDAAMAYKFPVQKINLKGVKADAVNDKIEAWINSMADTAISAIYGGFVGQFQQLGEGLYETAIRLLTDKAIVQDALDAMGVAFTGTTQDLVYFSESLINMAGDLDTLQDYFSKYTDAFLTEEQRVLHLRENLVGVLHTEGIVLPQTREAYADLVSSLNLMTDSGENAYYTLLALSDAADQYYTYLEKQSENIVDTLQGYVDKLQSAKDKLLGGKNDQSNFATGMQTLREVLGQIQNGSYNGLAGIDSALNAVTSLSMDRYGSYLDYQRDYYRALGVISELESLTSGRLTEWQAIQDTLQTNHDEDIDVAMAQLQALIGIHTAVGAQGSIGVPGYATGGSHPGGWRVVGENGPELEYTGPSSIYNNDRSRSLVDIAPLVEKLDRLIERVEAGDSVKASSLRQIERAITGITEDAFDADDRPALRVAT